MGRVNDALRALRDLPRLSADYAWSLGAARTLKPQFAEVQAYVEFIGYPRTGHTLIGSLMDAHSEMVIGNELGALRYLMLGFSMPQIYALLLRSSQEFSQAGRTWSGYRYDVADQWQGGRYTALRVLGDQQGMGSSLRFAARPWLLDRLRAHATPLRFVHVHRNLFDSITTQARSVELTLEASAAQILPLIPMVAALQSRMQPGEWLDIAHDDFIADPRASLRTLAAFLGLGAPEDWIEACAGLVFEKPRRSRTEAEWPPALRDQVQRALDQSRLLAPSGYRFEVDE
jgi:hypothetical protein